MMKSIALLFVVAAVVACTGLAHSGQDEVKSIADRLERRYGVDWSIRNWDTSLSWARAPFTDSREYRDAEHRLSNQFASASERGRASLLDRVRSAALEDPRDPRKLFEWAFVAEAEATRQGRLGHDYWHENGRWQEIAVLSYLMAMARPESDVRYVTLRYRLARGGGLDRPDLIPLARRLLKRSPRDPILLRCLATQLAFSQKPADFDEAERLMREVPEDDPDKLGNLLTQFNIAAGRYDLIGHHPEDRAASIRYARAFVAAAPKGSPARLFMEHRLSVRGGSK